eukprot:s1444_g12.t1
MNVHMHLILLVPAILSARCVAGASCQDAVFTDPSENGGSVDLDCLEDADQTLHLIQRRAKAKEEAIEAAETTLPPPLPDQREDGATRRGLLPLAARLDLALGGLLGLVQWSPALNVPEPLHGAAPMHQRPTSGARSLEAGSEQWVGSRPDRFLGDTLLLASWACLLVCFFLHSALCARASRQEQDPDTRVSCKVEEARLDANVFLESLSPIHQLLRMLTKASFWRALFKAVSRRSMILLMACAWLSAFLEFLESFEQVDLSGDSRKHELWLVFENEGFSLTHFLFKTQPGSQVVERSTFWWLVKQGLPWGGKIIKNFAYQLLQGLAVAHHANITHRDVKGSNVFVTDTWPPVVRLGDWGSALKTPPTEEVRKLYGQEGPTEDDETSEYKPPEAGLFDAELLKRLGLRSSRAWRSRAYDLWSLGILLLELVLGTRDVYHVDDRRWWKEDFQLQKQGVPKQRREQGAFSCLPRALNQVY